MTENILEAKNVFYSYSKKGPIVLNDMNIQIPKGRKTALLGCNGAGKSTLFSVLNALYKPQQGQVLYKGTPIKYKKKEIIKMRTEVSILFQNPNDMMFKPYVDQDVAYGPENLKLPKDEVDARVDEALFAVGMEKFRKAPIMKLSYGQRKRVTLAGVLAMKPSVMIMDEPTAGLDPQMAYEVMEIAEQLHSSGVTVLLSSHDTDLVYSWADEVRVLGGGKCVYAGESEPFYSDWPLVQKSGLMLPSVFKMNKALADTGNCPLEPYPKSYTQLSLKTVNHGDTEFGTLHVLKVDTETDINAALEAQGLKDMETGIYGMAARVASNKCEFEPDLRYNGPEGCTMNCLSGKDSVLICDSSMLEKTLSTIEFSTKNGYGGIKLDII